MRIAIALLDKCDRFTELFSQSYQTKGSKNMETNLGQVVLVLSKVFLPSQKSGEILFDTNSITNF
jgi:hypothetical protein